MHIGKHIGQLRIKEMKECDVHLSAHNISSSSISSSSSSSCTEYSTDDEAFPGTIPVKFYRVLGQDVPPDQPIRLDVNLNQDLTSPCHFVSCLTLEASGINQTI